MTKQKVRIEVSLHPSENRIVMEAMDEFWKEMIAKKVQECPGSEEEKKSVMDRLINGGRGK